MHTYFLLLIRINNRKIDCNLFYNIVVSHASTFFKLIHSEFIFLGYMLGTLKNSVKSFKHFFIFFYTNFKKN